MKKWLKIACLVLGCAVGGTGIWAISQDSEQWNSRATQLALTAQVFFLTAIVLHLGDKKRGAV